MAVGLLVFRPVLTRLPFVLLSSALFVAGIQQLAEGWRLEPLTAYSHAKWWGVPDSGAPSDPAVWRPESSDGRHWAAYSQVLLEAANGRGAAAALAEEATAAVKYALALGPVQPSAWARLSVLELNRGGREAAVAALMQSWRTGPAIRNLAWLRGRLGLFLWDRLPVQAKGYARSDLARLWDQKATAALPYPQQALVRFAHGIGRLDAVREALPIREHALLAERIQSVLMEAAGAS